MVTTYSREEISRHDNEKDLWIVIHGGVYDITKFLKEHPGGEEVLINLAGKDGTTCFDDIGHTTEAVQLCETFRIGNAIDGDGALGASSSNGDTKGTSAGDDDDDWQYEEKKKEESNSLLLTIVAAGVLIYAILIYYLWF